MTIERMLLLGDGDVTTRYVLPAVGELLEAGRLPGGFEVHEEAEESWRVLQPVLDAWARDEVSMLEYPAGSDGPQDTRSS